MFVRLYIYECEDIILLFFSTRERSVTIYYKDLPIIISSRCICAHVFGRPVFFVPHIHVQIHTLKTYSHNRIMLYISVYDAHDTLGGEHYDSRTRSKLMIKKKYKYPCVCVCVEMKKVHCLMGVVQRVLYYIIISKSCYLFIYIYIFYYSVVPLLFYARV